jgi:glycosyltransferase involved in cell wall biosynthesis
MPTSAQKRAARSSLIITDDGPDDEVLDEVLVDLADFPPVLLAVPTVAWQYTEAAAAIALLRLPPGSRIFRFGTGPSCIAASRNQIAEKFAALASEGLEYCLWIDSDMVPEPTAAAQLLYSARQTGADLMSGLYFKRAAPFLACFESLPGSGHANDLARCSTVEIARAGFGCMLMRRRVVEIVPRPWFSYPEGVAGYGEDYNFCDRARAHGLRIFLDYNCECGHLAVIPVTRDLATAWHTTKLGKAQVAAAHAAEGSARREVRSQDGTR